MDIKVDINVLAPELVDCINRLAVMLSRLSDGGEGLMEAVNTYKEVSQIVDKPMEAGDKKIEIIFEGVRAKLAELSQAGKHPQVKALIEDFGEEEDFLG